MYILQYLHWSRYIKIVLNANNSLEILHTYNKTFTTLPLLSCAYGYEIF